MVIIFLKYRLSDHKRKEQYSSNSNYSKKLYIRQG